MRAALSRRFVGITLGITCGVVALPRVMAGQAAPGDVATSACATLTDSATPVAAAPAPNAAAADYRSPPDTGHAAIRLLVSASAKEITFTGTPRVCVRLTGAAQLDSMHILERRNLSSPVVSGRTYRDVYVAVEILGRLNAACIANALTGAPTDSAAACAGASIRRLKSGPPRR